MTVGPVFEASRRHNGCARMRRYVAMALSAFTPVLQVRVSSALWLSQSDAYTHHKQPIDRF